MDLEWSVEHLHCGPRWSGDFFQFRGLRMSQNKSLRLTVILFLVEFRVISDFAKARSERGMDKLTPQYKVSLLEKIEFRGGSNKRVCKGSRRDTLASHSI